MNLHIFILYWGQNWGCGALAIHPCPGLAFLNPQFDPWSSGAEEVYPGYRSVTGNIFLLCVQSMVIFGCHTVGGNCKPLV